MKIRTGRPLLVAAVATAMAVGITACGEDDSSTGSDGVAGNGVDRAFAMEMVPHHRSAVDMAEVAAKRSQRDEIKQLAQAIISAQTAEIETLETLDQKLEGAGVKTGELGMAEHEMGMSGDASMLEDAKPFDRQFIDMMIPHHQGAIRMARVELEKGENTELKALAQDIVDAQAKEIDQMNTWRVEWFGGVSPAGGVPSESSSEDSDHGM